MLMTDKEGNQINEGDNLASGCDSHVVKVISISFEGDELVLNIFGRDEIGNIVHNVKFNQEEFSKTGWLKTNKLTCEDVVHGEKYVVIDDIGNIHICNGCITLGIITFQCQDIDIKMENVHTIFKTN